jgi:hypothetical protein
VVTATTTNNSVSCGWARDIRRALLAAAILGLAAACSETAPTAAPEPQKPAAKTTQPVKVNLDEIFPPGPGRELVLNNCQSCHVWVPIVILQMDQDAWRRNSLEHRERVKGLSDEEFKTLYEYLSTTFTPERPVPKLPPELLETWTSY